ncbi:MAG: cytochrome P450 [Micromonosporaceae bacterium]|nr:cytochrome P450 [Micromonosporaceae bacterium]
MATDVSSPSRSAPGSTVHGLSLLRMVRRDPLTLLLAERRAHGPVVRLRVPQLPLYLVTDPEAIQEAMIRTHHEYEKGFGRKDSDSPAAQPLIRALGRGLLTSDAQLHRRQRRLIQPMFHHDRIAGYGRTFVELAGRALDDWRDGEIRDVHRDMAELTLAIVARTVFDVDIEADVVTTIRVALAENQDTLRRSTSLWGRVLNRLPVPSTRRWNASERHMNGLMYRMIEERRAAGATGDDLLSLLLSARDKETGEPMSDTQVRDEAVTLLLAGHETTANALAFALHLLASHPVQQQRARDELTGVLCGQTPTVADLRRLPYTNAVVSETMRLYPPAWMLQRRLTQDRLIGGYRLPKGATLFMPPWVVHRDPELWPEPDAFRPERWLTDPGDRHRYAYYPFGGGPRQCIGNDFATVEASLVLATLLPRWRLEPAPDAPPVVPLPLITLRPRHGVWLTVARA